MISKHAVFYSLVALALGASPLASTSLAATVNSNVALGGTFNATLNGSGQASLTGANGTFRQWIPNPLPFGGPGTHTNINVSANPQTVGISIPTANPGTMNASGFVDLDFDNVTPGTPLSIQAIDLDLNGATIVPFTINVAPMSISTSLGSFQLELTVNGAITDIFFNSNSSSNVVGNEFAAPGEFGVSLNGVVTGRLVNVPILNTINLGTIYTIDPTTLPFEADLSGDISLSDLQLAAPFPHDMLAVLQNLAGTDIPVPLNLPIAVAINQSVPSGQSGFSVLNINGNIDATLNLGDVSYSVNGVVPQALVPEPGSIALGGLGLLSLIAIGLRRRRAA